MPNPSSGLQSGKPHGIKLAEPLFISSGRSLDWRLRMWSYRLQPQSNNTDAEHAVCHADRQGLIPASPDFIMIIICLFQTGKSVVADMPPNRRRNFGRTDKKWPANLRAILPAPRDTLLSAAARPHSTSHAPTHPSTHATRGRIVRNGRALFLGALLHPFMMLGTYFLALFPGGGTAHLGTLLLALFGSH